MAHRAPGGRRSAEKIRSGSGRDATSSVVKEVKRVVALMTHRLARGMIEVFRARDEGGR